MIMTMTMTTSDTPKREGTESITAAEFRDSRPAEQRDALDAHEIDRFHDDGGPAFEVQS